jgi:periplasmic protein TonB
MEVLRLVDYKKSEPGTEVEFGPETGTGAETKAGAVKHNGPMGLFADRPASRQPATTEPSALMAESILTPEQTSSQEDLSPSSGHEPGSGHELDSFLGKAFQEEPIWASLWERVQDVFFPVKLPPLELTSTPIPVPDRMAVKANPWAIGISSTLNVVVLLLAIWLGIRAISHYVNPPAQATNIDISDYKGPKSAKLAGGGGGGGDRSIVEANKGKLPQKAKVDVTPPQAQTLEKPKIPMPPTIDVQKNLQLPDNPNMPMIGTKESANVTLASNGTGSSGGMGSGRNGGLGSGNYNGYGPGSGGNAGGGLYQVGGGISAPVATYDPNPDFSDEARRAKYQGVCLVSLIVDAQGNPQDIRVTRALGMGLDEKAVEAVRTWKFKPAMKDGKTPVPVEINIEVNFRLY